MIEARELAKTIIEAWDIDLIKGKFWHDVVYKQCYPVLHKPDPQQKPLTDDEIISIGFKAGFAVDTIEDDETEEEHYGFIDEDGNVDNEPFIKFVRLVEKARDIGDR